MHFLAEMTMHTAQLPSVLRIYPKVCPGENRSYESRIVWGMVNDVDVGIREPFLASSPESRDWYFSLVCG